MTQDGVRELPLRAAHPKLFDQLQIELEALHIHPYDIEAGGIKNADGTEVILKYGMDFNYVQTKVLSNAEIEKGDPSISEFFKKTAEECQKALVADYFKMMKS